MPSSYRSKHTLFRILYATETDSASTIERRRSQQQFAMFGEPLCLREIPNRTLRFVVFPTAHDCRPSVLVRKLVGPLPNVANQVHHSKRTRTLRMRIHRVRSAHDTPLIRSG